MRSENGPTGRESGAAGRKKRSFIEEARRAQIVQAAIETIAEAGYENASLARIARHAGISKGVISYHFAGKDALLDQVVVEVYTAVSEHVGPLIMAEPDTRSALRAHILSVAAYMREHRTALSAVTAVFHGARNPDGTPRYGFAGSEPLYEGFESLFRAGQESGELRPFDCRVMAVTLQSSIDTMFGYWFAYPDHDLAGHAAELADAFDRAVRAERRPG